MSGKKSKDQEDTTPSPDAPEGEAEEVGGARARIRGVAKRLLEDPVGLDDAKELLGTVLDGSDRARTEIVRLVGREVRNYLDGLGLQEDLKHLMENYSLEVSASFHLKPLQQDDESAE